MPRKHLLRPPNALGRAIFAWDRRLCNSQFLRRDSVCDDAFEILHIHVRLTAPVRDPQPSTVAAARGACREVSGDFIRRQTLPWRMLGYGKHHEVLHRHLGNVRLVADRPCCAGCGGLVVGVQLAALPIGIIVQATPRRGMPVLRVVAAVGPVRDKPPAVRKGSERSVVGQLHGQAAAGREFKILALQRRDLVTASICLHPPL